MANASSTVAAGSPQVATLLDACLAGQSGGANPHLCSSPMWFAHEAGRELSAMSTARACRMSRGYSVRVETAASIFVVAFAGNDLQTRTVTRK